MDPASGLDCIFYDTDLELSMLPFRAAIDTSSLFVVGLLVWPAARDCGFSGMGVSRIAWAALQYTEDYESIKHICSRRSLCIKR